MQFKPYMIGGEPFFESHRLEHVSIFKGSLQSYGEGIEYIPKISFVKILALSSKGSDKDIKVIKEEISNQGFSGSISTVGNAAIALCDMLRKTPIGENFLQGEYLGRAGLQRKEYEDVSIEAVAYSIFKFAKAHEITMLRVSDLYKSEEEHGVFKEFRTSQQVLFKKLRAISAEANRVLIAELAMGLDHITLRNDLTAYDVLSEMTK